MTAAKLKLVIGWGLIALVALIPFHALAVISLGHWLGHEAIWASWKEVLLLILAAATGWYGYLEPAARLRLMQPIVYAAAAFVAVACFVSYFSRPGLTLLAFGLKTDLEFILSALIALVIADKLLVRRLVLVLLGASGLVALFAILQATVLPRGLLLYLGYAFAPGQTAPYESVVIGHTLHYRFGSTLGGPNQLGTFLILPLGLSLAFGFARRWWWLLTAAILPALFITYSRGAWLGAFIAASIIVFTIVSPAAKRYVAVIGAALLILAAGIALIAPSTSALGQYLRHPSLTSSSNSDTQHLSSLQTGTNAVINAPFGHGLGTAGPATFHSPKPNIIENNYLQIAYETGLLGLTAFVIFVSLTAGDLLGRTSLTSVATAAAILGISVTALVLPAWTDTASALTVWTVAGASLGARHV